MGCCIFQEVQITKCGFITAVAIVNKNTSNNSSTSEVHTIAEKSI